MARPERLARLFRAFRDGDDPTFLKVAEAFISDELASNHVTVARELRAALGESARTGDRPLTRSGSLRPLPKGRRTGESLLMISPPRDGAADLVLSDETRRRVERVVDEWRYRTRLSQFGYRPKSKLLFYGPPGCGKSLTAHHLADQLGLPVGTVRLSAVVSSFLGDTAAHVQSVFDSAASTPMVLLLDEFDTLAKSRDDPHEVGELKRVVNSLLQAMEHFKSQDTLVIAASNHQHLLDPAIWRRFDDALSFPLPSAKERQRFLERLLNGVSYAGSTPALTKRLSGVSFAAVERVIVESIKTMILAGRTVLTSDDVDEQIDHVRATLRAARKGRRAVSDA